MTLRKTPQRLSTARPTLSREDKIDQQMEDSFPASDPPSYSGGNHIVGAPPARESGRQGADAPEVKDAERKANDGGSKQVDKY